MISPKSSTENYYGAEPNMKEENFKAPFDIEFWVRGGWEIWARVDDLDDMDEEINLLKERGFDWKASDSDGKEIRLK